MGTQNGGSTMTNENLKNKIGKEKIFVSMINTKQNEELLKTIPNRPFLDLSIVYRMLISDEKDSMANVLIGSELAKKLQLSENDLYTAAMENTSKLFPCTIKNINEVITEAYLLEGDVIPPEIKEIILEDIPEEDNMYVLSNEKFFQGAAFILFEDQLERVANIIKSDFFVMLSSIHECVAISAENRLPEEWTEVVRNANEEQVVIEDRLSNQIYYYDSVAKKITIATNIENKELD